MCISQKRKQIAQNFKVLLKLSSFFLIQPRQRLISARTGLDQKTVEKLREIFGFFFREIQRRKIPFFGDHFVNFGRGHTQHKQIGFAQTSAAV